MSGAEQVRGKDRKAAQRYVYVLLGNGYASEEGQGQLEAHLKGFGFYQRNDMIPFPL
jgi:hypothetical protein